MLLVVVASSPTKRYVILTKKNYSLEKRALKDLAKATPAPKPFIGCWPLRLKRLVEESLLFFSCSHLNSRDLMYLILVVSCKSLFSFHIHILLACVQHTYILCQCIQQSVYRFGQTARATVNVNIRSRLTYNVSRTH